MAKYSIYFTNRAYTQLTAEVERYPYNETGGVLIGRRIGRDFFVYESIDPGFDAYRSRGEFRRQYDYVTHLAYVVANTYDDDATVIGYWHRHPSCYDHFSSGDDITNNEFADMFYGAISGLINIDPDFRVSFWYISPEHQNIRVYNISVNDDVFKNIMHLKKSSDIINCIENQDQDAQACVKKYGIRQKQPIKVCVNGIRKWLFASKKVKPEIKEQERSAFNISKYTYMAIKDEISDYMHRADFEFKRLKDNICKVIIKSKDGGMWNVLFEYKKNEDRLYMQYYDDKYCVNKQVYKFGALKDIFNRL